MDECEYNSVNRYGTLISTYTKLRGEETRHKRGERAGFRDSDYIR